MEVLTETSVFVHVAAKSVAGRHGVESAISACPAVGPPNSTHEQSAPSATKKEYPYIRPRALQAACEFSLCYDHNIDPGSEFVLTAHPSGDEAGVRKSLGSTEVAGFRHPMYELKA